MRFMVMHKNDPNTEAGMKPSMEIVQQMGEVIGGYAKTGQLIDGAGLSGSATRRYAEILGGTLEIDIRSVDAVEG